MRPYPERAGDGVSPVEMGVASGPWSCRLKGWRPGRPETKVGRTERRAANAACDGPSRLSRQPPLGGGDITRGSRFLRAVSWIRAGWIVPSY